MGETKTDTGPTPDTGWKRIWKRGGKSLASKAGIGPPDHPRTTPGPPMSRLSEDFPSCVPRAVGREGGITAVMFAVSGRAGTGTGLGLGSCEYVCAGWEEELACAWPGGKRGWCALGGFCCLVLDTGGGDGVVDGTAFPTHCLGGFHGRGGLVGDDGGCGTCGDGCRVAGRGG